MPQTNETLQDTVDRVMRENGYLLQEDRRIAVEVLGGALKVASARLLDLGNLKTEIGNLSETYLEKHLTRVRAEQAAHQLRLNPKPSSSNV